MVRPGGGAPGRGGERDPQLPPAYLPESVSMLTNAAAEPERLSREEIDALCDVLKGLEEKEHG